MFSMKLASFVATLLLAFGSSLSVAANPIHDSTKNSEKKAAKVQAPLNLAILIQDDLTARVGSELNSTRDFIRSLPRGSRVMVGYITTGTLQVRQPFTTDLEKAAGSLRIPLSSTSASPFNPYVEVVEALHKFEGRWSGRNAVLLISDGLDTSRGFDSTAAGHTLDLERAIKEAKEREIAIYTFYAPSVGLTGRSHLASSYGQSSLNRIAEDTGGKAFFQGSSFVTFDSYFDRLSKTLNERYGRAS